VNKRLIRTAFAASLGGFVFGYDLGSLSSASQSLRNAFHLSPVAFGLTISISLWGTVCGSLLAGGFADRIGRRYLVAGCAAFYAVAAVVVLKPGPQEWILILSVRFLCGVAIGGFTVGCPLYLSELAPISHRGRFVSLFQVQVGVGVIVAFIVGSILLRESVAGEAWKWSLGIGSIPAAYLAYLLLSLPHAEPESSTALLCGGAISIHAVPDGSIGREKLFRRKNMRPILLATSIAIFNQLSGVNILLLYMLDILASAGISLSLGHTYTIVISCVGLATTLIAMTAVDNWGRKPLLLIGSAGMGICLFSLAVAVPHRFAPSLYLSVLVAYNVLFPPGIRGAGQGYGSSVHWIANAILVVVFPAVQHVSSVRTFYFFALVMAVQIGVVWFWYPETRRTRLGLANL
jgi:MFS transporter, SP family, arabinose:H+ symporter